MTIRASMAVPLLRGNGRYLLAIALATAIPTAVGAGQAAVVPAASGVTETLLYSFAGGDSDGALPMAGVVQGSDGNFYGTTDEGGPAQSPGSNAQCLAGCGTIFELTPAGVETVLHVFAVDTTEGANPVTPLVQNIDGHFYGSASIGGTNAGGLVFQIDANGNESPFYSFGQAQSATNGGNPAGLVCDADGNLYGTAGTVVFKLDALQSETVLHIFAGGHSDGSGPDISSNLILASDGSLYGTTVDGGAHGQGVVFKLSNAGESVLYSFAGPPADGAHPVAGLVEGPDGNFYGTTYRGGTNSVGTVYKITPAGVETVLHSFTGGTADGQYPSGLFLASDGNFYGTTGGGGSGLNSFGTVFEMTPDGTETVLYSFQGFAGDGTTPKGGVIQASDGSFYGTTSGGGAHGQGAVFKLTLPGALTATPTFGLASGSYTGSQAVTLSDSSGSAVIYYTTDGSPPTINSTQYSGPITVSSSETISAIALAPGLGVSPFARATYSISGSVAVPAAPTFQPAAGSYSGPQSVTIADGTAGAVIHYTTDGSTPTLASAVYSSPIAVASAKTIKAIAINKEFDSSSVASAAYQITASGGESSGSSGGGAIGPVLLALLGGLGFFRRPNRSVRR